MTPEEAIAALGGDPQKAAEMKAYHKLERRYLGVANPVIDAHVKSTSYTKNLKFIYP